MVKTSGKRKGYKIFGLIHYFIRCLFYQGQEGRLNSAAYIAFLTRVLKHTTQPIFLIHDNAKYPTSAEIKAFFAQQTAQHQDSPATNPIPPTPTRLRSYRRRLNRSRPT